MKTPSDAEKTRWRMTPGKWVAAGAIAIALVILYFVAADYGARYCTALKTANLLRDANTKIVPLDCREFWLNRYQGLIGNGVTAAVAAATLIWAARTWIESSRQSSVAVRDMIERKIANYAEELIAVLEFRSALAGLSTKVISVNFSDPRSQTLFAPAGELGEAHKMFADCLQVLTRFQTSEPAEEARTATRAKLIEKIDAAAKDAAKIGLILYRSIINGGITVDELAEHVANFILHNDPGQELARAHAEDLEVAQKELWLRVERLERAVLRDT